MRQRIVGGRRLVVPEGVDAVAALVATGATVTEATATARVTVHDTPQLVLLRRGITVARRESPRSAEWCVHLPATPSGPPVGGPRVEWSTTAPSERTPQTVLDAVGPLLDAAPAPVVTAQVASTTLRVAGVDAPVCVRVDTFEGRRGRRNTGRVVVAELIPVEHSTRRAVDDLDATLRTMGAVDPSWTSPVVALLGADAPLAPYLTPAPVDRTATVAEVVEATLLHDVDLLVHHWPLLHLAPTPRSIHSSRVALRRLRSHLRLFGALLDPETTGEIVAPVRALAATLGPARELDVLADLVADIGLALTDAQPSGVDGLLDAIHARRAVALAELTPALASPPAAGTVRAVIALATAPPLVDPVGRPARDALTELTRRPWRRLRAAAADLDDASPVEQLHRLRLLTKRARYAAEVAGRVRPAAARHAVELRRLQRVLGDLNDVAVGERQLRALALDQHDVDVAFVAGLVAGELRRREDRVRAAWPAQWERTRRRGISRWLERS